MIGSRRLAITACGISLGLGIAVGLLIASPAVPDDPSEEFRLTVFNRDFIGHDMVWNGRLEISVLDLDKDGFIDRWTYKEKGQKVFELKDRNGDHKLDSWWRTTGDNEGVLATDEDFDGVAEEIHGTRTVVKY